MVAFASCAEQSACRQETWNACQSATRVGPTSTKKQTLDRGSELCARGEWSHEQQLVGSMFTMEDVTTMERVFGREIRGRSQPVSQHQITDPWCRLGQLAKDRLLEGFTGCGRPSIPRCFRDKVNERAGCHARST